MILAIKSEVRQDHEVFGDPKRPLYCSISKKLGAVSRCGKSRRNCERIEKKLASLSNPSVDKEQFWVI
jgi:hypothetical protein